MKYQEAQDALRYAIQNQRTITTKRLKKIVESMNIPLKPGKYLVATEDMNIPESKEIERLQRALTISQNRNKNLTKRLKRYEKGVSDERSKGMDKR